MYYSTQYFGTVFSSLKKLLRMSKNIFLRFELSIKSNFQSLKRLNITVVITT